MKRQRLTAIFLLLLVPFFIIASPTSSFATPTAVVCTPPDASGNPTNSIDQAVQKARQDYTQQLIQVTPNVFRYFPQASAINQCMMKAEQLYDTFSDLLDGADDFNVSSIANTIMKALWKAIKGQAKAMILSELATICQGVMQDFTSVTTMCMPSIPGLGLGGLQLPMLSGCSAFSLGNGMGGAVSAQDLATYINANSGNYSTPIPNMGANYSINQVIHR